LLVLLLSSSVAGADAPPRMLLRGSLTDSAGQPVDGMRELHLSLYTAASGGEPFFSEAQTVMVSAGAVTVALGATSVLDLGRFLEEGQVYLGVAVGGEAEMSPRVQLHTVPYAAMAQHVAWESIDGVPAAIADGYQAGDGLLLEGGSFSVDPALFQRRLGAACGDGQALAGIDADGAPTCVPLAAALSGACPPGSMVTGIGADGALACSPDLVGPTYTTAGGGIFLDGTTFSLIYGQGSGTVTAGNDRRLNVNPVEDGWLTYSFDNAWVPLLPGMQGDLLHTRPPEVGPPYWGPLLAEEVPPGVTFYIWNQQAWPDPPARQTASFDISGNGLFGGSVTVDNHLRVKQTATIDGAASVGGKLTVTGAVDVGGRLDVDEDAAIDGDLSVGGDATVTGLVLANGGIRVGDGSDVSRLEFFDVDFGSLSFSSCPTFEFSLNMPDGIPDIDFGIPIATCFVTVEVTLTGFTNPSIFLGTRNDSSHDTFAATWHPVDEDTIRISVNRTDLSGGGWGDDLTVHVLAIE
jgi:hypothetical protein